MRSRSVIPSFFLVGCPKCGTTAMDRYLSLHPDIYMARLKDTYHFADDLLGPHNYFRSRDHFLALFDDVRNEKEIGESSGLHMVSRKAADNIHRFNPDAKILVMLRNPVDVIASWHSQLLYVGAQKTADLRAALEEQERQRDKRGVQVTGNQARWLSSYFDIVDYPPQLRRFLDRFGKERVHVVLFDQLAREPATTYLNVLKFLRVDHAFTPPFEIVNANKEPRSVILARLIERLTPWGHRAAIFLPPNLLVAIKQRMRELNSRRAARKPIDRALRLELSARLRGVIEETSELIEADLSSWYS